MSSKRKVAFYTLGCKLNFSETSSIARNFTQKGYQHVEFNQKADIYVINTCSVTDNADREFKRIVKKAFTINSEAFIIAVGCYAQLQPKELLAVEGVDLVLGTSEKFNILSYVEDLSKINHKKIHSCDISEVNSYVSSYSIGESRTRAFLKVQDGCDYKCTYCTIPLARGVSRSDELQNVLDNARRISNQDVKEIVLTGVNIGDYGKGEFGDKTHENTFFELITALDQINDIKRFRISSIEPNLLKNEIIDFVAKSKTFVPHFHIPLQSGSNEILKSMRRRYPKELYTNRVSSIKSQMADACIGVDVIVGFPGETDEHFLETYDFLDNLDISYLHVFTYSERPNTLAEKIQDSVPKNIRFKRSKILRGLSVKKKHHFYQQHLNAKREVLFETENKDGFLYGFSDNYIRVKIPYNDDLTNTLLNVTLSKLDVDGVVIGVT